MGEASTALSEMVPVVDLVPVRIPVLEPALVPEIPAVLQPAPAPVADLALVPHYSD